MLSKESLRFRSFHQPRIILPFFEISIVKISFFTSLRMTDRQAPVTQGGIAVRLFPSAMPFFVPFSF